MKYLALLRGINVGGNNIVKMAELRACCEGIGLKNVTTYIQSGNLLLESRIRSTSRLSGMIEAALGEGLLRNPQVMVVSQPQLEEVVLEPPAGFGMEPGVYLYDVAFLKPALRSEDVLRTLGLTEGVDDARAANDVLYFKRLASRASQSRLSKVSATAAYKQMTVRNWTTTRKLFELMSSR